MATSGEDGVSFPLFISPSERHCLRLRSAHWLRFTPFVKQASSNLTTPHRRLWQREPFITEGLRRRGERARNLFDTFLCGCNCVSCFAVVSFREGGKNAKTLPIKPGAMSFFAAARPLSRLCPSPLFSTPPHLQSPRLPLARVGQQCVDERDPDKFRHSSQPHASKSSSVLKMFFQRPCCQRVKYFSPDTGS